MRLCGLSLQWVWFTVCTWLCLSCMALALEEEEGFPRCHSIQSGYVCSGGDSIPLSLPQSIRSLHLINTKFETLTDEALRLYPNLTVFRIAGDRGLKVLPLEAFHANSRLRKIIVKNCTELREITDPPLDHLEDFLLPQLEELTVHSCPLQRIPKLLSLGTSRLALNLPNNKILEVPSHTFCVEDEDELACTDVSFSVINLQGNPLRWIGPQAFEDIYIRKLDLSHNNQLSNISDYAFDGSYNIDSLLLDHCNLSQVPKFLSGPGDSAEKVQLSIQYNPIKFLERRSFCDGDVCSRFGFRSIDLRNNRLESISDEAFEGISVQTIDLSSNRELASASTCAFCGITGLKALHLDGTGLSRLPYEGLSELETLSFADTPHLTALPSTTAFRSMKKVEVTYSMHCCAFKYPEKQMVTYGEIEPCPEGVTPGPHDASKGDTTTAPYRQDGQSGDGRGSGGLRIIKPELRPPVVHHPLAVIKPSSFRNRCVTHEEFEKVRAGFAAANLQCSPQPNAFNPCVDIMETDSLRVMIWIVAAVAVGGNLFVLTFSFLAVRKDTCGFLLANLACADACMGIYLVCIATQDSLTRGAYFNHAYSWQYGGSCGVLGFITVLASELSVYTLCTVTVERWYAIKNAIQLTKRMQMRHAVPIMAGGWLLAVTIAALPLAGVNSYEVTSICLPLRFHTVWDKVYVCLIITLNGCGFLLVLACYINMFCRVRGSHAAMAGGSDLFIAKRMGVLIFSNFICWGPVIFVSALSAGGINWPLTTDDQSQLTVAKILLVLFYPFNSCADPFIYVVVTKRFRQELFRLTKRCGRLTGHAFTGGSGSARKGGHGGRAWTRRRQFLPRLKRRAGSMDASTMSAGSTLAAHSGGSHHHQLTTTFSLTQHRPSMTGSESLPQSPQSPDKATTVVAVELISFRKMSASSTAHANFENAACEDLAALQAEPERLCEYSPNMSAPATPRSMDSAFSHCHHDGTVSEGAAPSEESGFHSNQTIS